ncbi:MAG: pyridoxamine 5'-phosphate oxidase family protein [Deltaproteobacteria bacterium]|jgi:nitroimidazol reductase NimA-like FMN-containing flavoprotein (pyridoxamine 5'-phosphate oxidase superfamily)|nr:pyridoxamine 5'-phosphate oxidase family protein [Deltaproteobacteria bacterium]
MRRSDRRLSDKATLELLRQGEWGVLCLAGEEAYGVPVNYVLDDAGGEKAPDIFLHCATEGKKLDYIGKNPSVCLCVVNKAETLREEFSTDYASVMVMARAEIVLDERERLRVLRLFGKRFTPFDLDKIDAFIAPRNARLSIVRLRPLEMSGKARAVKTYEK